MTILKWMKMVKSSSKRLQNTVGKGEIAHYELFLILPQCFHNIFTTNMSKQGLVWERVMLDCMHRKH